MGMDGLSDAVLSDADSQAAFQRFTPADLPRGALAEAVSTTAKRLNARAGISR